MAIGNPSDVIKEGDWTPMQQMLAITVLPPWYQTWWFILSVVFVVVALIVYFSWLIIQRRNNRMKWKMKEHEQQIYEDKVRFLINVSHELRTPLTLINAPLKRTLKQLSTNDTLYPVINAVYRQSNRMKDLLNMVLDLRRMEVEDTELNLALYSINDWIKEQAEGFLIEAEAKGMAVCFELDPELHEVGFDKDKCSIVLANLIMNAIKYSSPNSEIIIQTKLLSQDNRVRISVIDEGCGLHHLDTNKLFTRFYQGNHKAGGSGIGQIGRAHV